MRTELVLGSRKSRLALVQAGQVRDLLNAHYPQLRVWIAPVVTQGDRARRRPLTSFPTRGLFTKELENALLRGKIDLAVHSYKDLPTMLPAGLEVVAVLRREPAHDVLIAPAGSTLACLPRGARLGTSSLRRRAQVLRLRPDLVVTDLRGNLLTRLEKYRCRRYDALIVAHAGIRRLELEHMITQVLPYEMMMPAPAQGALALEARAADRDLAELVSFLDDPPTRASTTAERAFLASLQGGCQIPIGAVAEVNSGRLQLLGSVTAPEGCPHFRDQILGDPAQAAELGQELARRLLDAGAERILNQLRASATGRT